MTAPVRLVPAGLAYAAVLAALHQRCFEEAWSDRAMVEVLSAQGAFAVMALAAESGAETPVGFALARIAGDDAELLSLCVLPTHRGQGVATRLLDEIMVLARRIGARRMLLEVAETNDAARALYASRGFAAGRRRPDYYRAPNRVPVAALELYRDLGPA